MTRVTQVVRDLADKHLQRVRQGSDGELIALCPLHTDSSPSFAINTRTGMWICYAQCGGGGLAKLLYELKYSRKKVDNVLGPIRDDLRKAAARSTRLPVNDDMFLAQYPLEESVLGIFDTDTQHKSLIKAGLDPEMLAKYDIGWDRELHRVTFPVRDIYGNLAGISGRRTSAKKPYPDQKYRFYEREFRTHFPGYAVDPARHVWNADRVYARLFKGGEDTPVYLVEGFKACLWMIQNGYPNTMALMGSYMTRLKAAFLHRLGCPTYVFLDNDKTGRKKVFKVADQLFGPLPEVFVVELPWGGPEQPDDLAQDELDHVIENAPTFTAWKRRD